jgi:FdhD protein
VSAAVVPVPICTVTGYAISQSDDLLAVEEPLEIRLGKRSLSITMRTPGSDFELAAGFLFSEGLIRDSAEIRSMSRVSAGNPNIVVVELVNEGARGPVIAQRNFAMTSACGLCGKASLQDLAVNICPVIARDAIRIEPEIIHQMPDRLRRAQNVFASTGGLHAAALFNLDGGLESLREDIGRHNAVDKLIGAALLDHRTPLRNSLLLVSGRASFELVQKALVAGIPLMAAIGAPSSRAVATAERSGMTLLGFARDSRFNVYVGRRRIFGLEQEL